MDAVQVSCSWVSLHYTLGGAVAQVSLQKHTHADELGTVKDANFYRRHYSVKRSDLLQTVKFCSEVCCSITMKGTTAAVYNTVPACGHPSLVANPVAFAWQEHGIL